jgi:cytochrome c-type biogenesis protein CcmF
VNLLGELALWMALPVAIWGMVLGFTAGRQERGDLALGAERSVYAVLLLTLLASLGVIDTFLNDRFEYQYVAGYSNRNLETFYKVSGLWAGQTGSLLFWLLLLMLFSSVCVWLNKNKNREFMPYVVGVLQTVASFFLVVLLFADVNPFQRLDFTPADGRGLNPQLQNYWMTIHPPTLYLGFTSFTIPFAFAVAALLSGRLDTRWLTVTRKWTLLSWFFLSNGIIFGMAWAYEELGWGGYWFWDPVENASLLPWLTATAFLHSVQIQEKRGMLKVWNMSLVILTFMLTIFATFLTRSGLIDSVHTFAENRKIAFIFLGFMGVLLSAGVVLVLYRAPRLQSENQIESFLSREAAFLFNNLIFVAAAFAVLWGTLLPLLSEGFLGQEIGVGPAFFNRVNLPIGLGLLALTGIGPVIAWRKASRRNLRKAFLAPVIVGTLVTGAFAAAGSREWMALATFGVAAFVLTVIVMEFWKGTRARARIEGEGFAPAFWHLIMRNRRRWGGYIVHVGIVLVFTAFAGAAWNVRIQQTMEPGETAELTSPLGHTYTLTYEGMSPSQVNPNQAGSRNLLYQARALFSVSKDGKSLGTLGSEKRLYERWEDQWITEVGVRHAPLEDVYIILESAGLDLGSIFNDPNSPQRATFTFLVNPLVSFIWLGGLVLTLGGLIAMWPEAPRLRAQAGQDERLESGPVSAAAD